MPDHGVNPRVRATQERRRSHAAGFHDHVPTRGAVERAVVDAELLDLDGDQDELQPVDLDEVIDAEIVEHRIEDSPLHGKTRLHGRIVTDPAEIAEIAARVKSGKPPPRTRKTPVELPFELAVMAVVLLAAGFAVAINLLGPVWGVLLALAVWLAVVGPLARVVTR